MPDMECTACGVSFPPPEVSPGRVIRCPACGHRMHAPTAVLTSWVVPRAHGVLIAVDRRGDLVVRAVPVFDPAQKDGGTTAVREA